MTQSEIILISYMPGMSGDFLAYLLHKNKNFIKVENIVDEHNRYWFPPFIEGKVLEYGESSKCYNETNWPHDLKSICETMYEKQSLCVPTHWYKPTSTFDHAIRIYTEDTVTIRKAYACWWIKSHVNSNKPWLTRYNEIFELPEDIRNDMLNNFHNWKFLSYKLEIYPFDLRQYVEKRYNNIFAPGCSVKHLNGYTNIDLKLLLQGKIGNIDKFTLDTDKCVEYDDKNIKMLHQLEINIDHDDDTFFDTLTDAVEPMIVSGRNVIGIHDN